MNLFSIWYLNLVLMFNLTSKWHVIMRLMNILYTNPNTKLNIKVKIKCLLGNKILKYQIEKNKYQFKY